MTTKSAGITQSAAFHGAVILSLTLAMRLTRHRADRGVLPAGASPIGALLGDFRVSSGDAAPRQGSV